MALESQPFSINKKSQKQRGNKSISILYSSHFVHKDTSELGKHCQGQVASLFKPVHQEQSFQDD